MTTQEQIIPVVNLLTNSRQKTFKACPRLEQIKYRLLYMPKAKRMPLIFGTLAHAGLEAYWRAIKEKNYAGATSEALYAVNKKPLEDKFLHAKLLAMIAVYCTYWLEFAKTVEVLSVEEKFTAPLVNPDDVRMTARTWKRAGKLDAVIRLKNGMVAVLEHKTAGENILPGSNYRGHLAMDTQISMYFHGSIALGYGCDLCLYDILKKPKISPYKATPVEKRKFNKKDGKLNGKQRDRDETVEEYQDRLISVLTEKASEYFVHVEVGRTQVELDRDARDTWHTLVAMTQAEKSGYFYRNSDSCHRYGKPCEYIGVCEGVESLHDQSKFYKLDEAHPELQDEQPESEGDDSETVESE